MQAVGCSSDEVDGVDWGHLQATKDFCAVNASLGFIGSKVAV